MVMVMFVMIVYDIWQKSNHTNSDDFVDYNDLIIIFMIIVMVK